MGCSPSVASTQVNAVKWEQEVIAESFHDKYFLGDKLGRGAFAQVRSVSLVKDGASCITKTERAVKILQFRREDKTDEENKKLENTAKKEAAVWKTVGDHPNCVRLYDIMLEEHLCFMVMEKCSCTLFRALEGLPDLTERGLGNVFAQMLLGIGHCHGVKVIHRDIKPDNFLVGGADGQTVKLADFGLSTTLQKEGKLLPGAFGVFGTAPFMSPEMLLGLWYNEKSDMWSFASMVYVLLFGQFPFMPKKQNSKAMKQVIIDGVPAPSFKTRKRQNEQGDPTLSDAALTFVQSLLNRDAPSRPSAQEALGMAWMSSSLKGCHMPGMEMPSLRPMLYAAKEVGAFEVRDLAAQTPIDASLNDAQLAHHGVPLPSSKSTLMAKVSFSKDTHGPNNWDRASNSTTTSTTCGNNDGSSDQSNSFSLAPSTGSKDIPPTTIVHQ